MAACVVAAVLGVLVSRSAVAQDALPVPPQAPPGVGTAPAGCRGLAELSPGYDTFFETFDAESTGREARDSVQVTTTGQLRAEYEAKYDFTSGLEIRVLDSAGNVVESEPRFEAETAGGAGALNLDVAPGAYTVEASTTGNEYDVALYDCPVPAGGVSPDPTAPALSDGTIAVLEGEGAETRSAALDLTGVDDVRIAYAASPLSGDPPAFPLGGPEVEYTLETASGVREDGGRDALVFSSFSAGDDLYRDEPLSIAQRSARGSEDTTDELPAERRPGSRIEVTGVEGVRWRIEVSVQKQTGLLRPYDPELFPGDLNFDPPAGQSCRLVDSLGTIDIPVGTPKRRIGSEEESLYVVYRALSGPVPMRYLVADGDGNVVFSRSFVWPDRGQQKIEPAGGFRASEAYRVGITNARGDASVVDVYACTPREDTSPPPPKPPTNPKPPAPKPPALPPELRACVKQPEATRILGPGPVGQILSGSKNDDVIRVRATKGGAALNGKLGRGDDILYVTGTKPVAKAIDTGAGNDIVFFASRRAAQALDTGSGNDLVCVQDTATAIRTGSGNDALLARNHVGAEDMGTGRDTIRILKGTRNSTTTVDVRDGKGDDRIDARRTKGAVCRVDPGDRTSGCTRIR
jgi:hypothetical protein